MEYTRALRLRRTYDEACDHPVIEKEYYFLSPTGRYACVTCGMLFDESELDYVEKEFKICIVPEHEI